MQHTNPNGACQYGAVWFCSLLNLRDNNANWSANPAGSFFPETFSSRGLLSIAEAYASKVGAMKYHSSLGKASRQGFENGCWSCF